MREFRWIKFDLFGHAGYHLVCISDPGPTDEGGDPCGRQIVAEVTFERGRFGRQGHYYRARVFWDRNGDGRGHFPNDGCTLPDGSAKDDGQYWPHSWAIVGNAAKAKSWAEAWLARWLWQWDGCEVTR